MVSSNEEVANIFALFFRANFKVQVNLVTTKSEFSDELKSFKPELVMVFEYSDSKSLLEFVKRDFADNSIDLPVFSIGGKYLSADFVASKSMSNFSSISEELQGIIDLEEKEAYQYAAIQIENFFLLSSPCCDIYIKLKKSEGDEFVKRINAGDLIDKDSVRKYKDMKVDYFYVRKSDFEKIIEQILSGALKGVVTANQDNKNIIEVTGDSFEISQNFLDDFGVKASTVRVARATIKSMLKSVSTNKKLSKILKEIMQDESSYSFKRSFLNTLFFNEILPYLGWGKGTQVNQIIEKIAYVSFFHDCYLRDEKLLRINWKDELDLTNFSETEYEIIDMHANNAATLLQQIPNCPSDVDVIIRQHHGTSNGVGFADKLTSSISPITIVFIVIEAFSTEILNQLTDKKKLNIKEVFTVLNERFPLTSYNKHLELLKNMVMKSR